MPLILSTPPLCTYAEASSVLNVFDVVLLGKVAELRRKAMKAARA